MSIMKLTPDWPRELPELRDYAEGEAPAAMRSFSISKVDAELWLRELEDAYFRAEESPEDRLSVTKREIAALVKEHEGEEP